MRFLRQNTAVIVSVGPFFDKTDGVTIETALTITNERITLVADTDAGSAPTNILDNVTGATTGTANDLNYITNNDAGMMQLELAAADTNRVGRMLLSITDAANHVPVFHEFFVLPQAIYDWITGVIVPLPSNMTQILGTAVSAPATNGILDVNLKNIANAAVSTSTAQLGVNAVQAGGTAWASGAITAAAIADNAIDMATLAADLKTGSAIKANVETVTAGAITAAAIANGAIDNATFAADVGSTAYATNIIALAADKAIVNAALGTAAELAKVPKSDSTVSFNATALAAIADAICDEAINTGHATANTLAKIIYDNLNAPVATVDTVVDTLATELAKVPKSDSTVSWNATALAAINAEVDTALNTAIPVSNTADSINDLLLDQVKAKLPTNYIMGSSVQTAKDDEIDAILEDTGTTLPATLVTIAGYIDTEIGTLGTELAKVPKSDSNVTWNATALASINAEVDGALNTAIPGGPTADSINQRIVAIDVLTEASGAGDLAAILTDTGTTLDGKIDTIDGVADAILLDTGTDGVVVASGSKTGYALSDAGVDAIWDRNSSLSLSFETLLNRAYQMVSNKMNVTEANGNVSLRNIGDTGDIATGNVVSSSGTTTRAELTWA